MTYLNFFSSIINSLAWPISVLLIAFLFRENIKELLNRNINLKIGNNEITLAGDLAKEPEDLLTDTESIEFDDEQIAKERPDLHILNNYKQLQDTIKKTVEKVSKDNEQPKLPSGGYVKLYQLNVITKDEYNEIGKLGKINNDVVHNRYGNITYSDAITFKDKSDKLIESINDRSKNIL